MNLTHRASWTKYPFTIIWVAAYLGCLSLAIWTSIPDYIGVIAIFLIAFPAIVLLVIDWAGNLPDRKRAMWIFLSGLLLWGLAALLVTLGWEPMVWIPINTVALLVATLVAGFWIAGELEKSGHLIPVCILGTLVDVWSVASGPSKMVAEKIVEHQTQVQATGKFTPPPFADFLTIHWPYPGAIGIPGLLGMGDLIFAALIIGAVKRFNLPVWKTFLLVTLGLEIAAGVAMLFQAAVPALPFVCILFLAGNWKALSLTGKEWKLTISMAVIITVVGLGNYLVRMYR